MSPTAARCVAHKSHDSTRAPCHHWRVAARRFSVGGTAIFALETTRRADCPAVLCKWANIEEWAKPGSTAAKSPPEPTLTRVVDRNPVVAMTLRCGARPHPRVPCADVREESHAPPVVAWCGVLAASSVLMASWWVLVGRRGRYWCSPRRRLTRCTRSRRTGWP